MRRGIATSMPGTGVLAGAVLAILCALAAALPATAAAGGVGDEVTDTTAEAVVALRHDRVLVDPIVGSGDATGADERLSGLVEQLKDEQGIDAYVALVAPLEDVSPDDASSELSTAAQRGLRPGVYVVKVAGDITQVTATGGGISDARLSIAVYDTEAAVRSRLPEPVYALSPVTTAEIAVRMALSGDPRIQQGATGPDYGRLPDEEVEKLAAAPYAYQPRGMAEDGRSRHGPEPTTGLRAMAGTTVGLLVTFVSLLTLLRAWPGWRRRRGPQMATAETAPRRERPVRDDVAALAREELTALTDALAAAPPVPSAPGRSALAARVAAESPGGRA